MKIITILSLFLVFTLAGCAQHQKIKPEPHLKTKELAKYSQASFAAGCFWHEEAMFESLKGVKEVVSGYAGGTTENPTYESIETGATGYAETVNVFYDSTEIDFPTLLKIYFSGQDATQVNGQGPDHGPQYRSIVFYRNDTEKQQIEAYIRKIQPFYKKRIAAQVMPFSRFWEAEDYHQDFIEKNPGQGYVQAVSIPEIKHLQKQYPDLVKPGYSY
jgi:peptide-methionine (S)-S-oxide reductase